MKKDDYDFILSFCKDCQWYKKCDKNYICPPLETVIFAMIEDEEEE